MVHAAGNLQHERYFACVQLVRTNRRIYLSGTGCVRSKSRRRKRTMSASSSIQCVRTASDGRPTGMGDEMIVAFVGFVGSDLRGSLAVALPIEVLRHTCPIGQWIGRTDSQNQDWAGELANQMVVRAKNRAYRARRAVNTESVRNAFWTRRRTMSGNAIRKLPCVARTRRRSVIAICRLRHCPSGQLPSSRTVLAPISLIRRFALWNYRRVRTR